MTADHWSEVEEAVAFAVECVNGDRDPLNDRERADGNQYVLRMMAAVAQSSTVRLDPDRPGFLTMLDTVRYLGAAGPDIDYDVSSVRPGATYRITGRRGGASYVGIAVYAGAGESGATAIVRSVDVDSIVAADGTFRYEFSHPDAARVIIRQYFHDRSVQARGEWTIEKCDGAVSGPVAYASAVEMDFRIAGMARSLRWNAQLNRLWTPERRERPNEFVRQTSDDIVAAIPNPDVNYSFTWWRVAEGEVGVIDLTPPETVYWAAQLCDRWFQCFPERSTNLNDRQVVRRPDGSVRIVIADSNPGTDNWLDNGGHRTGVVFFRWLHADVTKQPRIRVMSVAEFAELAD